MLYVTASVMAVTGKDSAKKKSYRQHEILGGACFLFEDKILTSLQSLFVLQLQLQQTCIKSN